MSNIIATRKKKYAKGRKIRDVETCKHWLSGIVKCSSCGRTLSHNQSNYGNFQCWGFLKGKCNTTHSISEKKLTRFVLEGLKALMTSDNIPYQVIKHVSLDNEIQIEELQRQMARLNNREARAKAAYLDGIDSKEEYRINKENIQRERAAIEHKISELLETTTITASKAELDARIIQNINDVIIVLENPSKDYIEKGKAIRSIVEHIVFNQKEVTLDFSLKLEI